MRLTGVLILAGALAGPSMAQNDAPDAGSAIHEGLDRSGQVMVYNPGKTLAIDIGDKREKNYDLTDRNITIRIDPGIRKGSYVKFQEETKPDGGKVVTVNLVRQGK